MRVAALLAILLAAAPAVADAPALPPPDPEAAEVLTAMKTYLIAFDSGEDHVLRGAFAPAVKLVGLTYSDAACTKALRKVKVAKKSGHARLARCLLKLANRPTGQSTATASREGKTWTVDVLVGDTTYLFGLARRADRTFAITSIDGLTGNGEIGGVMGGVMVGAPPPPPPPPPPSSAPQVVPVTAIEALRISGDKNIVPDEATKAKITADGKSKIVAQFKLCLDTTGAPTAVTQLKSSGYPAYDHAIQTAMRAWRYRPYLVMSKPAPVCTAVTFIFSQK